MTVEAVRAEIVELAQQINDGAVSPSSGAGQIWLLLSDAEYPDELAEFRVFVGMASEIQDRPEHEVPYTEDIRREARAVIARHGA
jgi:hypothetical protein